MMLHGCSQTPRGVAVATQWNELAEEHNFIVAYPTQTLAVHPGAITGSNGKPGDQPADDPAGASSRTQLDPCWQDGNGDNCWNWFLPDHQSRGAGEPAIIAGITRVVLADTAQWTIDPARVYVAGMSAGGAMAVILGATYPDLYSAVAAHSALEYQAATDIASAVAALTHGGPNPVGQGQQAFAAMGNHARLMPVLVVQGTNDLRVNPVNGDQVIQQWLETNRLATGGMFTRQFATPTTDTPTSTKPHPAVTPTAYAPGTTTTARSSTSTGRSTEWAMPGPVATGWDPLQTHKDPTSPGACTPSCPSTIRRPARRCGSQTTAYAAAHRPSRRRCAALIAERITLHISTDTKTPISPNASPRADHDDWTSESQLRPSPRGVCPTVYQPVAEYPC
jgi:poly(hydroxyalkanoate) depolymerase family esterase